MEAPRVPSLQKVGPAKFLREVAAELKKVNWPTRQETIKLTLVVLAISVLVGAFIGGTDAIFLAISTALFRQ
ncbi:preprotein translocase subunit SecE [Candidatus Gottesmanbacteria bacterium RBG_16_52_11]|uniref:Protein translocase subunit SecE n=1 Tax=Candidatus Gottesmanbacteria bacterium RBG_16_52_11 TaxID=1798374 RepID=A0A1F5YN54_9BACT|nr:MAG: preprotein translocase subunit SecE [Candidatus Gottesmanbacteria bacterium RBG_16_52_11]